LKYYDLMKDMATKFNYRFQMVKLAKETSVSNAARVYGATRKTVLKHIRRFDSEGLSGLKDKKTSPKNIPHKMNPKDETRIIKLRKSHPSWGARRLKERYSLSGAYMAIHRVMKQGGLIKPKKRRWKKRRNLNDLKKKMFFFENSQIDTKDLSDILKYWPLMRRLGLPRYEFALRELSTGLSFFAYADENTTTNASKFADYVAKHLKSYGIKTARITWQTDNGSEYIGNVRKKTNRPSAFEKVLLFHKIEHGRIPPRCSWMQGDVETFNRIVEDEFFDVESYKNPTEFWGKVYAYHLYFNYIRKNRYRDNQSPLDILRERFPDVDEGILNLPPIWLDRMDESLIAQGQESGYHVPIPALKLFK
jgi:transposase